MLRSDAAPLDFATIRGPQQEENDRNLLMNKTTILTFVKMQPRLERRAPKQQQSEKTKQKLEINGKNQRV